jgi:hypothetical protein
MKLTYIVNRIILSAAVVLCLSSCQKEIIDLNQGSKTIGTDNSIKLTEEELLRKITLGLPVQDVKTSVAGKVLTLVYTEDVNVILDAKGYDLSYSIRFDEDFFASFLNKCSYTLPGPNESYTTDWAGNDLKVLNEITKSDIIVNGKAIVNMHLVRYFTFTKSYATAEEAISQQNMLLNAKTDVVKFTSYVVFGKEYPATTVSALVVYSK